MLLQAQFPRNLNKLIQSISTIDTKISIFEYHEIALVLSALRLPFPTKLQLAFAVAVITVVALIFDQHELPGICHNHKIGIVIDVSVQAEAFTFNNSVPPFHIIKCDNGVNKLVFAVVHVVPLCIIKRFGDGIRSIGGRDYRWKRIIITAN